MERFAFLQQALDDLAQANLLRKPRCIEPADGPVVKVDGRQIVSFASNNYLSIADHPAIKLAVSQATEKYGYGSGASRLIVGTGPLHIQAEQKLAELFGKEAALIFPSGWAANGGLLATLPEKGDLVLMDKQDHASIIDAAKSSGAKFVTYRRQNPVRLEKMLAEGGYRRKYVVTESIFSMDGDAAGLKRLVELKKEYGTILIVDEAHAIGCLGNQGAGLAQELGVLDGIDIVVGTMSKALGASGGVVAGPAVLREYLINKVRSFIYTTAPSGANCAAVLAALDIVKNEPERRHRLRENSKHLRSLLEKTDETGWHIIPLVIGDEKKTLEIAQNLLDRGFLVPAIRPPTVAPGTSRLRISVQAGHTPEQIKGLCEAIKTAI